MPFKNSNNQNQANEQSQWYVNNEDCSHPEHDPPQHMVLKPGTHVWICPGCGNEQKIIVLPASL